LFDDPKHFVSLLSKLAVGKILINISDKLRQQSDENDDNDQFGQRIKKGKFSVKLHLLKY